MERSRIWHTATAENQPASEAAETSEAALFRVDALLQRRAMLAMVAAMGAMASGLPSHLAALPGLHWHIAAGAGAWVAAALATVALGLALPVLRARPSDYTTLARGERALLLGGAAAAYGAGWVGLLGGGHGLLYFDVAAMSAAWLLEGQALDVATRRRAVAAAAQLALLTGERLPPSRRCALRGIALPLGAAILAAATLAAARALHTGSPMEALIAALAAVAACCPCTLGRARASAFALGHELAARQGWIVTTGAALGEDQPWQSAIGLPGAGRAGLAAIGRRARRAARCNVVWAAIVPLLLLPVALRGPVDPLLPAAAMVIAWAAIGLTDRMVSGVEH